MRAFRFVAAARRGHRVLSIVAPIAGSLPGRGALPPGELLVAGPELLAAGRGATVGLLADPVWRERLARVAPLPAAARVAPAGLGAALADSVLARWPSAQGAPLHVMRSYLAPLGIALSARLGSPWRTLDLDDDDVSSFERLGLLDEAASFDRLIRAFGPLFEAVALSSPTDQAALCGRGISTSVVPNAVAVPEAPQRAPAGPPVLLFVGALDYEPNRRAAERLVFEVLPRVRSRTGLPVTVDLVGPGLAAAPRLAGQTGVRLHGYLETLEPRYETATAVVAPMAPGGGTKTKILEAMAHRVPVVTTAAGAAGLGALAGRDLLIGEGDAELADHVAAVIEDPATADRLAGAGYEYVRRHHSAGVVERAVSELLEAAQAHGRPPIS